MTLPERTLRLLAKIDSDRARAIAKLVDQAAVELETPLILVGLDHPPSRQAIILIRRCRYLDDIPWIHLTEVSAGRMIISVPVGTAMEKVEVAVQDVLESHPEMDIWDRTTLDALLKALRDSRRSNRSSKHEILIVEHKA